MKHDRLSEAAANRARIHAFVLECPGVRLGDIAKAVPGREYNTISRIVGQMCQRGELRREGSPYCGNYHAVGESVGDPDRVRVRFSQLAKARQHDLRTAAKGVKRKPRRAREESTPKPLIEPGIVRNYCAHKAPIKNQGGQGVIASRPRMSSVIGSLG